MRKSVKITILVTPEFKAMLERDAKDAQRSVTGYIEWVVTQEAKRKARRKNDAHE